MNRDNYFVKEKVYFFLLHSTSVNTPFFIHRMDRNHQTYCCIETRSMLTVMERGFTFILP